jgi:hypothetical protein
MRYVSRGSKQRCARMKAGCQCRNEGFVVESNLSGNDAFQPVEAAWVDVRRCSTRVPWTVWEDDGWSLRRGGVGKWMSVKGGRTKAE